MMLNMLWIYALLEVKYQIAKLGELNQSAKGNDQQNYVKRFPFVGLEISPSAVTYDYLLVNPEKPFPVSLIAQFLKWPRARVSFKHISLAFGWSRFFYSKKKRVSSAKIGI